jgi:dihydrolipoamide dehydrogenase
VLVAIGRRPNTRELGLDDVGIEPDDRGFLKTDDRLRVGGSDWLYAIGDVNGRALLTHMGKYQARVAADVILGRDAAATAEAKGPPRVVFTEPQVAAVGLTLEKALDDGIDARAVDAATSGNAGASFIGKDAPGTSRLVVDEGRRVLVGATFVGPEIAESLHAATIAVVGEVSLDSLWHAVPSFPTRSEVWLKLLEEYGL